MAHAQSPLRWHPQPGDDRENLIATAEWLERAQDATNDGGIAGRYHLRTGWSSSYPETTGYIVPTFLDLERELQAPRFRDRAQRAIEFLLRVQLPEGGFPGLEISKNRTDPSPFNTAQILHGLIRWYETTSDERARDSAIRAGDWLLSVQDDDGAWRRHLYLGKPVTYSAHASCWLAQLGHVLGNERFLEGAARHLDWTLRHANTETGWIDLAGFKQVDHDARRTVTHTLAYTLWGVLYTSQILGRSDGIEVVRRASAAIIRRLEISRHIPGVLDADWRPQADYACVTGNLQLALIWLRLYELDGDPPLLNAALKAIDLTCVAQSLRSSSPGIRGGVPGSYPLWGKYIPFAFPNWAAKFFIDALIQKRVALSELERRPLAPFTRRPDLEDPKYESSNNRGTTSTVVLYTREDSSKTPQILRHWETWGFKPACVVVEQHRRPPLLARAVSRVARLVNPDASRPSGPKSAAAAASAQAENVTDFCRRAGIPVVTVADLGSDAASEAVRALAPAVAVLAGAGIVRAPLLSVPSLGTLNAHMGLLPTYRGMNVAEWAAFNRHPTGCSVHWVDSGIDTGGIICARTVDTSRCRSIAELRRSIDTAQLDLLGEVVRAIAHNGAHPQAYAQSAGEGRQYFEMHPVLKDQLEQELARGRELPTL
jgi:folate-dependent phosphoribosylglycinamide formyltransferase PurN